jgi:diacylglycerol kinase (ATP)
MRAAVILGLGASPLKYLQWFGRNSHATWQLGLPAHSGDADAIVVFGGDGTVHRHLAPLAKLQLPLLVVPCGSGNDFARALHLGRIGDSIAAWRKFCSGVGNVRAIDLGVISPLGPPELKSSLLSRPSRQAQAPALPAASSASACQPIGHYFCCVGGVGLDAEIARRANQLPPWIRRRGGYLLSLLPALLGFRPVPVMVRAGQPGPPDQFAIRHQGPAMVVAFANAPAYGDGIKIAPAARLDDGKLDVCVVGNMGKVRLLRLFPSVYSGSHLSISEVKYFQTERLQLETELEMDVYADGEYVCRTPVEVRVAGGALRAIVP